RAEPLVDRAFGLAEVIQLVRAHQRRVRPAVADLGLDLLQLFLRLDPAPLPAEHHFPVPVVRGDRHHHLAGDVTAEDDQVGLVEGGSVEELPPADFRAVYIGREEDSHRDHLRLPRTLRNQRALCATCSTSWKAASSSTDASMCDFFWQLVPADAVAHVRAELP